MHQQIQIKTLVVGKLQTNCYLITDFASSETIVLDPGDDADYITQIIEENKLKPVIIIATHGHFDHILASWHLQKVYHIPFAISPNDEFLVKDMKKSAQFFLNKKIMDLPPEINMSLNDQQLIKIGSCNLEIITTPGHTPGGISLYDKVNHKIFVGDTVFAGGGVGRTDFKYCDEDKLWQSIKSIMSKPPKTEIFSGHGKLTSIEKEALIFKL
ncbi:MAG: Beta-lactamase domain protein [Candidatus Curtissbacteria bacterium GW2011_GWA1_40_16]|uniref:Beta-lactamase domain protein n=1 Tax=Candidatus Curtissbacteria bacterium GW2011_GWA1_40_16 TaxID=1618405 RepID=A0A0G0TMP5_9BACT|nr:MAG: Beta-lactamase domain protein [Candidatus Curtissbacteria bacterium GW2011_GWA1_40_16]